MRVDEICNKSSFISRFIFCACSGGIYHTIALLLYAAEAFIHFSNEQDIQLSSKIDEKSGPKAWFGFANYRALSCMFHCILQEVGVERKSVHLRPTCLKVSYTKIWLLRCFASDVSVTLGEFKFRSTSWFTSHLLRSRQYSSPPDWLHYFLWEAGSRVVGG